MYDITHAAYIDSETVVTTGSWQKLNWREQSRGMFFISRYYLLMRLASVAAEFYVDDVSMKRIVTAISGLSHLEGKTVSICADGVTLASEVVASGAITIDDDAHTIHIGLPYDSIVEPMKLHAGAEGGTARGKQQRIDKVTVAFYETGNGVQMGPDADNLLDVQGLTDGALTTEDLDFEFQGDWKKEATIYIKQSDPVPMTIRAISALRPGARMIEVVPYCSEHAVDVLKRNIAEKRLTIGLPNDWQETAKEWEATGPAYTLIVDGTIVACAGVVLIGGHRGEAWSVMSSLIGRNRKALFKAIKEGLDKIIRDFHLVRVQSTVFEGVECGLPIS